MFRTFTACTHASTMTFKVGVKRTNDSLIVCLKEGKENKRTLIFMFELLICSAKCTSYMYMTVWFLVPASSAAEDVQFDSMREC